MKVAISGRAGRTAAGVSGVGVEGWLGCVHKFGCLWCCVCDICDFSRCQAMMNFAVRCIDWVDHGGRVYSA